MFFFTTSKKELNREQIKSRMNLCYTGHTITFKQRKNALIHIHVDDYDNLLKVREEKYNSIEPNDRVVIFYLKTDRNIPVVSDMYDLSDTKISRARNEIFCANYEIDRCENEIAKLTQKISDKYKIISNNQKFISGSKCNPIVIDLKSDKKLMEAVKYNHSKLSILYIEKEVDNNKVIEFWHNGEILFEVKHKKPLLLEKMIVEMINDEIDDNDSLRWLAGIENLYGYKEYKRPSYSLVFHNKKWDELTDEDYENILREISNACICRYLPNDMLIGRVEVYQAGTNSGTDIKIINSKDILNERNKLRGTISSYIDESLMNESEMIDDYFKYVHKYIDSDRNIHHVLVYPKIAAQISYNECKKFICDDAMYIINLMDGKED